MPAPRRRHIRGRNPWDPGRAVDLHLDIPTWMFDGTCNEVGSDLFFPELGDNAWHAKKVCSACPVKDLCLDYALTYEIRDGIWGGTSAKERSALRGAVLTADNAGAAA